MTGSRDRDALLQSAVGALGRGALDEADTALGSLLARYPDDPDGLHLAGQIAFHRGRADRAAKLMEGAVARAPRAPLYRISAAMVQLALGDLEAALALADSALALSPMAARAHLHRGTALLRMSRLEPAREALETACRLEPGLADAWNSLGILFRNDGRRERAEACYRRALEADPDNAPAHNNLGALLLARGLADEAVMHLDCAIARDPGSSQAHNNLGQAHQLRGDTDRAAIAYREALAREPERPLWKIRLAALCPVIPARPRAIDVWRKRYRRELDRLEPVDLAAVTEALPTSHAEVPYYLVYQGRDNLELRQRHAALFHNSEQPLPAHRPGPRPKIAFLLTAGHEGIFLTCNRGLIPAWENVGAELTIVAPTRSLPVLRASIQQEWVRWLGLPEGFTATVRTIREARFDLVYFWEVGTDAVNYFLPWFRLAPVQCTSWGTSESSGVPDIDYYISARVWEEGSEAGYSEELVLLDRVPACFDHPGEPSGKTAADFGLDPERPIYLCPQNAFKLHPELDAVLAELLRRDPLGQLVLVAGKQAHWTALLLRRLGRAFGEEAMRRLHMVPRQSFSDYLALLTRADVVLDSFHFSGGATSYHALAMGTPIVTLPGHAIHGRFTYGYYRQMGLTEGVAEDPDDYLARALSLGNDREAREAFSRRILVARDGLLADRAASDAFRDALIALACGEGGGS